MNRLKDLREARGMKQLELASLLRVTRQAISRYEIGDRDMSPDTIAQVCRIFGCTADYLLGLSSRREPDLTPEEIELLAAYKRAPDSVRAGIDALLSPYKKQETSSASLAG